MMVKMAIMMTMVIMVMIHRNLTYFQMSPPVWPSPENPLRRFTVSWISPTSALPLHTHIFSTSHRVDCWTKLSITFSLFSCGLPPAFCFHCFPVCFHTSDFLSPARAQQTGPQLLPATCAREPIRRLDPKPTNEETRPAYGRTHPCAATCWDVQLAIERYFLVLNKSQEDVLIWLLHTEVSAQWAEQQ